jgi:hypothetical protein
VVQSTEHCFGMDRARIVESMPRLRQVGIHVAGRRKNVDEPGAQSKIDLRTRESLIANLLAWTRTLQMKLMGSLYDSMTASVAHERCSQSSSMRTKAANSTCISNSEKALQIR